MKSTDRCKEDASVLSSMYGDQTMLDLSGYVCIRSLSSKSDALMEVFREQCTVAYKHFVVPTVALSWRKVTVG